MVESWELMFAVLSFSRCGQLEFRSVRKWVVLSWCRKSSKHPPKPSQSNASLLYSLPYVSALCIPKTAAWLKYSAPVFGSHNASRSVFSS